MTSTSPSRAIRKYKARSLPLLASLLAIGIVLAGCAQMPTPPVPAFMQTAPASATVTLCDSAATSCSGASTFSLGSIRDLNISVTWQNVPEETHTQTTRIFSPDGELFQAMETSFLIPEGSPGTANTVQTLPVIGTWITQRQLTGTWTITVALDGEAMASNSVQFTQ
jgi:hypothetical protein